MMTAENKTAFENTTLPSGTTVCSWNKLPYYSYAMRVKQYRSNTRVLLYSVR
jgi:hypothetical protein